MPLSSKINTMNKINKYPFPVTRIGNEVNPKLIILLENPGSNIEHIKWNPEYAMKVDGLYQKSGMPFSLVKEYIKWWYELSEIWSEKVNLTDKDVLSLEYYPYPTSKINKEKRGQLNKKNWDDFALNSLDENKDLIKRFIRLNVPIFVYFQSQWLREVPELETYKYRSLPQKGSFRHQIKKRLKHFLKKIK
jgi:hypothetical protein